jgi:hypothetical protein
MIHPLKPQLRPADLVQVRAPAEILATLDADGTLDGVVFMEEMLPLIGRRFRVFRRLEKTCVEGSPFGIGEFHNNDVVLLDGIRCPGSCHDQCARSCMIFWKEAWLAKVDAHDHAGDETPDPAAMAALRARLRAPVKDGQYFCQSTNLVNATRGLSGLERLKKVIADVRVKTYTIPQALRLVARPLLAKALKPFVSRIPKTDRKKTPKFSSGLQPGDWIEVKSIAEIAETLDVNGQNRGLQWSMDLAHYSGRRFRVAKRLERMIVEYNGKMMNVSDTVLLEGASCPCKYVIGGCPRADLIYWREIWLRKIEDAPTYQPPAMENLLPRRCAQEPANINAKIS